MAFSRKIAIFAMAALGAAAAFAEMAGSSENAADRLVVSTKDDKPREFELTPEYDPDTGEYWTTDTTVVTNGTEVVTNTVAVTNFVYYFKMTCKRSKDYTVWIEGANSATIRIDSVEPREPTEAEEDLDKYEPGATFEEISGDWGTMWYLRTDEWSTEEGDADPLQWDYIIKVEGEGGDRAVVHYVQANALPLGIEENPKVIGAITNEGFEGLRTDYYMFVTNMYSFCFSADLKSGRRYVFATERPEADTSDNKFTLSFGGAGKATPYAPWQTVARENAMSYDPDTDDATVVTVEGSDTNYPCAQAGLRYRLIPCLTMAQHEKSPIEVDGDAVSFKPGRINARGTECYDRIIDYNLFEFSAKKGVRYVASTYDAETNVLIRVYDGTGKILKESYRSGDGTQDARAGFTVPSDGTYYVGVAQHLEDDDIDEVYDQTIRLVLETVKPKAGDPDRWDDADDSYAGASLLAPVPTMDWGYPDAPETADTEGHGWHKLGRHDWYDTFAICCREGLTYMLSVTLKPGEHEPTTSLKADVFYMNGNKEVSVTTLGNINPFDIYYLKSSALWFVAKQSGIAYVRIRVSEGYALDYPSYRVHCVATDQGYPWNGVGDGLDLAALKVTAKGNPAATWSFNSEKTAYPNGATIVVPLNSYDEKTERYKNLSYTVKYSKLKGFNKPADTKPAITAWSAPTEIVGVYTDTFDPKDDYPSGKGTVGGKSVTYAATTWSVKAKESTNARTFWSDDPADNFSVAGKDGTYFDFWLTQKGEADDDPDAVFSIVNGDETLCENVTEIHKLHLPTSKAKYILKVSHKDPLAPIDTSYSISGFSADVGAIKFAKNAVTVKENAAYVTLTVNRTGKAGRLKVFYETKSGTAVAGDKFFAQAGMLVWENGDNKAKTITIKLIPDIVGYYHGTDRSFSVVLSNIGDPGVDGEYPAKFPAGDTATVTLGNSQTKKTSDTIASAYKPIAAKSVKTEDVPLRAGTFFGVAEATEDGAKLTNGLPQLASVSVTVASKKGVDSLSAKVQLAGKSYAFKSDSKTPLEWKDAGGGMKEVTVTAVQKVGKAQYENSLTLTVADGATTDADAWKTAGGEVSLVMNVPDAKGSGLQEGVVYKGEVFRDNSKIDAFLKAAVNFVGYYTMALAPRDLKTLVAVAPGNLPAGNGYLTVTVDNGGKTKGAGMLADGTKVSLSAAAACIVADAESSTGYSMYVPVYAAKSPYCFGGLLKFKATGDVNGDGRYKVVVVGADSRLVWFNDSVAVSASGEDSLSFDLFPVGGFYDTVERLQRHYFDSGKDSFAVDTVGVEELPDALFTIGKVTYSRRVATQQADGFAVDLAVDAFSTPKKSLAKDAADKKKTDFVESVNPANVQVKVAKATGLVTGSFSVWAESETGAQKEITGAKHYGVVFMSESELPPEEAGGIGAETMSAGFFNLPVNLPSGTKTRKWTYSAPFNIKGE